jgi:hypothetical protein
MGTNGWLWKDPRLCLTLPFWAGAIGRSALVLMVRNPIEISASLRKRDGFSQRLSLALWEAYSRQALGNASGFPVTIVKYETILGNAAGWAHETRRWLLESGVPCSGPASRRELEASIEPSLRHTRSSKDELRLDPTLSDSQLWLFDYLDSHEGAFRNLQLPQLPPITPWASIILEERRRERQAQRRKRSRWYRRSRRSLRLWVVDSADRLGVSRSAIRRRRSGI